MDDTTLRQPFKLIKNKNCIKNGFVPQKVVLHSDGYSFLRSRKSDPLEGVLVSYMNTYTLVTCTVVLGVCPAKKYGPRSNLC